MSLDWSQYKVTGNQNDISSDTNFDWSQYSANKKPKMVNIPILGKFPDKTEFNQFLNNPETVKEIIDIGSAAPGVNVLSGIAGKGITYVPQIAKSSLKFVKDFPSMMKTLLTKNDPKELIKEIQAGHDKLLKNSSDIYDFIKQQTPIRGVNNIEVEPHIFNRIKELLPKTRQSEEFIERAKTGEYDAIHKLQSDLGKRGIKALTSDLKATNDEGEELLDLRDMLNESISNRFKEYGAEDLSKLLDEARQKYKFMKSTYYSNPTIGKIVNPELREIPKNPLNVLSRESIPMDRLKAAHPNIQKAVELEKEKENIKNLFSNFEIKNKVLTGVAMDEIFRHLTNKGK